MAIQAVSGERTRKRTKRRQMHPLLRKAGKLLLFLAAAVLLSIVVFRFVNPPTTSVMALSQLRGATVRQQWVPLDRISPELARAVISSEDGRFCLHWASTGAP